jgi:predicted nucleotide-binding protein
MKTLQVCDVMTDIGRIKISIIELRQEQIKESAGLPGVIQWYLKNPREKSRGITF